MQLFPAWEHNIPNLKNIPSLGINAKHRDGRIVILTSAMRHPAGERQLTILEIRRLVSKKITLSFSIS
jgi:hypothetical protein